MGPLSSCHHQTNPDPHKHTSLPPTLCRRPLETSAPSHTPLAPRFSGDLGTRWGSDVPRRGVRKGGLLHFLGPEVQLLDDFQPKPFDPGGWGGRREERRLFPSLTPHPWARGPGGHTGGQGPVPRDAAGQLPLPRTASAVLWRSPRRAGSGGAPSIGGLLERQAGPVHRGPGVPGGRQGRRPCRRQG